ncbi:DNA polymerase II [Bowmanella sp. JS7-9]|uniref:DNA polymerase n=1 Tax=Pseudobowmanella zhangzhouensis TaxID=1537679 RepID=A0ABW1XFW2_9ALTE|nr:DNA polymerase II [Bowmanella sp. JS7-9]TBX21055.1 DNA polymerase II [Bowmanella sp. JS7-9]
MHSVHPQGFILTRRPLDVQGKTCCEFWLATKRGPVRLVTPPQSQVFFIASEDARRAQHHLNQQRVDAEVRPLQMKLTDQRPACGVYASTTRQHFAAREALNRAGIVTFEDDIRLVDRYLMERFINGSAAYAGQSNLQDGYADVNEAALKPADYQPELKVLSLDIECSEKGELYSIGMAADGYQCVLMIGTAQADAPDFIRWVTDEVALLRAFVSEFNLFDADVVIGWAVISFDFKLLLRRASVQNVPLNIGRDGSAAQWRDSRSDSNLGFVDIAGRVVIDGIDALKTATYQFDSFSLEFVAQALLGKGKDTEDVANRMAIINHDFRHNKVKLARYNLMDCVLVLEIFAHTRMLDFLVLRSQLTGLELDRIGGSVAAFTHQYLPKFHRAGYVAPNRPLDGGLASPGGYVMESRPGLYTHVLVLDYKSLYPSIIRTFKIDPLGLVQGLAQPDDAIDGFKGAKFHRQQHFLPEIITSLWQQRDEAKKQQDAARSQAIKILMNSFYGVLGSGGCRFYDTRLASSITLRGHEIMQTTAAWIREQGYEVIYGDTDSTFVWLNGEYSAEAARQIGKTLQDLINQRWQQKLADEMQLTSHLEIEFETHFSQFLMPTIRGSELGSKKRYAGLKHSADGDKLVFKGLETVRSDWTALAREFQQTLYKKVFAGNAVEEYIRTMVADTREGRLDDKLVYKKRLRQSLDAYVKNVPPHVKAARLADEHNRKSGKPLQYQRRGWVKYVITQNGPEPLEYVHSPLDYEHYVEKQLRPIAEGILPFIGRDFEQIVSDQLGLF